MSASGRVVAVTGGGQGVGLELARIYAQRGDRVVICGRDQQRLEAACQGLGGTVVGVRCDVGDEQDLRHFASFLAGMGGVDILINNAAIQLNYSFLERGTDEVVADIDREFAADLVGPAKLIMLCLPQLRSKRGSIANVTSGLGFVPKKSAAVYCGSKAGLHIFSKSLRYQLAGTGVHVLEAVLPLVDTAMTAGRGSGKISPADAARQIVSGLDRRKMELHIGAIKLLLAIQRVSPRVADSILSKR